MIDLNMAPQKGICYALYSDREVIFDQYYSKIESIDETNLLELHLFDNEREFRVIKTEQDGFIVNLITDESYDHDDIYEEKVFTESGLKVCIVNYITYSEQDFLCIDNYRLKEGV